MPLQKQLVPLKLGAAGIDTGSNPQIVEQALLKVENARWTRKGAISKRHGFARVAAATERHVAVYKGEPVVMDRTLKRHEGHAQTSGTYQAVDTLSLWGIETGSHPVDALHASARVNVVQFGEVEVWAYDDYDSVSGLTLAWLRLYHRFSGRMIAEDNISSAGGVLCTRLIADTDKLYAVYVSTGTLRYRIVSESAIGAEVNTGLGYTPSRPLDACLVGAGTVMAIGRSNNVGYVRVAHLNIGAAYASDEVAIANPDAVACWLQTAELFVGAYWDDTTARIYQVGYSTDGTMTQLFAPLGVTAAGTPAVNDAPSICGIATSGPTGQMYFTYTSIAAREKPIVYRANCDYSTLSPPHIFVPQRVTGKARLYSKPWVSRGNVYVAVVQPDADLDVLGNRIGTVFIVDQAGEYSGKALVGCAKDNSVAGDGFLCEAAADGEAAGVLLAGKKVLDVNQATIGAVKLLVAEPSSVHCAETEHGLVIGNACPYWYDGEALCELGYLVIPDLAIVGSGSPSGGSLVPGATYAYKVTYEWTDAQGQLHRSAPSPEVLLTPAALLVAYQMYVPCLHTTNRKDVRAVLWRTVASGTVYYRVASVSCTTDDYIMISEGTADAALAGRQTLYTDGGQLENAPTPAGTVHCLHQGRHFLVHGERPDTTIRYSQSIVSGYAPEYNEALELRVPSDGGAITALRSFRDVLLAFKRDCIYAVAGVGYNAYGSGTGYRDAFLVSEVIGTTQQKSIVDLPGALAFVSESGIQQIDGKFTTAPLGDPVRHYTETHGYVTGVVLPDHHIVLFSSPTGPMLVYDFLHQLWATWTGHLVADAVAVSSTLVFVDSSHVWALNTSSYIDDTQAVRMTLESGHLSFAGLAGYKRLYRVIIVGLNLTEHTLNLAFQYDHDPTWLDAVSLAQADGHFGMADYLGSGLGSTYRYKAMVLQADPGQQKVTTFRVKIWDSGQPEGDNSPSFALTGMGALVGLKQTAAAKVGDTRRMS